MWNVQENTKKINIASSCKHPIKNLYQVAQEQQLSFVVKEQVKNVNVYLMKVSSRLRKLLAADKILCQLPRDETRSGKEIKKLYGRLGEMSVRVKE